MSQQAMTDPILFEATPSYSMFPVKFEPLWKLYKLASDSYWTAEEIDLGSDLTAWKKLTDAERGLLSSTLAFFASADSIVNMNLAANFMDQVAPQEAKAFYAFQMAMESVHSEVYSLLIDTYVKDPQAKDDLFNAVNTMPIISKKIEWAKKWLDPEANSFAKRLFAFAIFEGVYFQGSFMTIFYLKHRGFVLPGLFFSNELISRDEALHTEFATTLHGLLQPENQISERDAQTMMREAVLLEIEFITEALPCTLLGINSAAMITYIQFVGDRLMAQMGFDPVFGAQNPFPWMNLISMDSKVNFFESRNDKYSRANVHRSAPEAPGPAPEDDDF